MSDQGQDKPEKKVTVTTSKLQDEMG